MNTRKDDTGLTPTQRRWADHFLANGGNKTKAAMSLGMNEKSASVYGSRTSRKPAVVRYLMGHTQQVLAEAAPRAAAKLAEMMDARSEYVRLEAIKDVLNRNQIGVQQQGATAAAGISVNISLYAPQEKRDDLRSHGGGRVIDHETPGGSKTGALPLDPVP